MGSVSQDFRAYRRLTKRRSGCGRLGARCDDGQVSRIVAGSVGGRRIDIPSRGTRPTSERVREAVFSALEAAVDVAGARVLDLYAGSGALGFEALSRGAEHATFVEADRRAAQVLRRNADSLRLGGIKVERANVETYLASDPGEPYDIVLADPPYDLDSTQLDRALKALVAGGWTGQDSFVIVERSARSEPPQWPSPLEPMRSKSYGETAVYWAIHDDHEAD